MVRKRRGKGEGSIYRRKDGRWVGQYEINGKRKYVSGTTRAEVSKKLTKAIAERDAELASTLSVGWIRCGERSRIILGRVTR